MSLLVASAENRVICGFLDIGAQSQETLPSGALEAAEKYRVLAEMGEKHTSGAKAPSFIFSDLWHD
jgi:hypothetical protein